MSNYPPNNGQRPHPQQGQQRPQQQQQQPYPQQGQQRPQQQPQQRPQQPQAQPGGWVIPDDDGLRREIAGHKGPGQRASGVSPKFIKHPPPEGRDTWKQSLVGESSSVRLWLAPGYAADKPLCFVYRSHFLRRGRGMRLTCMGDDCPVCELFFENRYNKGANAKDRIKPLRREVEYLYNAVNLVRESDDDHNISANGTVVRRSAVVSFKSEAHEALLDLLQSWGGRLTHPQQGTSLIYKRYRKTIEDMGFAYTLVAEPPGRTLHQYYWPLCRPGALWNLEELYPPATPQEQAEYIEHAGFKRRGPTPQPSAADMSYGGGPPPDDAYGPRDGGGAPDNGPPFDDYNQAAPQQQDWQSGPPPQTEWAPENAAPSDDIPWEPGAHEPVAASWEPQTQQTPWANEPPLEKYPPLGIQAARMRSDQPNVANPARDTLSGPHQVLDQRGQPVPTSIPQAPTYGRGAPKGPPASQYAPVAQGASRPSTSAAMQNVPPPQGQDDPALVNLQNQLMQDPH